MLHMNPGEKEGDKFFPKEVFPFVHTYLLTPSKCILSRAENSSPQSKKYSEKVC